MHENPLIQEENPGNHRFIFNDLNFSQLSELEVVKRTSGGTFPDAGDYYAIEPQQLELNQGVFTRSGNLLAFPEVSLVQDEKQLTALCSCAGEEGKLCEHQALVLTAMIHRDELGVFFNPLLRREKLKKFAAAYGLEKEADQDHYFRVEYVAKKLVITPKLPGLVPVSTDSLKTMRELVLPQAVDTFMPAYVPGEIVSVVLRQHKHYRYLQIELYKSGVTKEGKIKNPLAPLHPLDLVWETEDHHELKFLAGVHKFQNHLDNKRSEADITALKAIVRNPAGYAFYYHDSNQSEKVSAASVVPVKIAVLPDDMTLSVDRRGAFYELGGSITLGGVVYALKDLSILFSYFVKAGDTLYLADQLAVAGLIDLLHKKTENLLIHASGYREFKSQLLSKLEDKVNIEYKYMQAATPVQLEQHGFNDVPEKIIYLSDFGQHVMIVPVMRYGEAEIPVRTKRLIYAIDAQGEEFVVKRDVPLEDEFTVLLLRQHPHFEEQLDNLLDYFYLHKKHFLDETWFLDTFEEWRKQDISILGFDEIDGNKLNPHKVKIDVRVLSGINWFNATFQVKYGKSKASLKHLHKAIRNKSKYVTLDDGTLGILPDEWIRKFSDYFHAGEILDDETLLVPKVSFSAVEQLYEEEMLDEAVKSELSSLRNKLADFSEIKEADVPDELHATLRPYQRQGLSWLNFLDDFNFGGCLADDMGLGKSIQIIAFILSQREKTPRNTNLIVVPATLIFNWQVEIEKFAPSIRIHTIYGTDRIRSTRNLDDYEVVLTSYGTLLSDINFLKEYMFNYIFLDESQNIKNPETQRYKAVRLLKSRNKIAITGTPLENNTFDLYGQLSFACPGLLGDKKYFRDVYSTPIDTFKNTRRARELQNKIRPFILRRTKQEVAAELPDKTEMILYCEMGEEQRRIYDTYEKEIRDYIAGSTTDELKKRSMNVLSGLTKLRQICDSPALLRGDEPAGDIGSSKIDMLVEQIENKAAGHKMLVFSQFVSMLDLIGKKLAEKGIPFVTLTGSTRNRKAVVEEFQENPDVRVFLISLKAGGTGLNLTEADYVYLVDPWWNPAVENQAIDRSHRIGQHKKVVAVRLICPGTVEEKILKLQESKRELADDLVRTEGSFLKSLSKADLMGLFG